MKNLANLTQNVVRLEFNPQQQLFHFAGIKDDTPDGWDVISERTSIDDAINFTDNMYNSLLNEHCTTRRIKMRFDRHVELNS